MRSSYAGLRAWPVETGETASTAPSELPLRLRASADDPAGSHEQVDLSHVPSPHSFSNKAWRAIWQIVYWTLFRLTPSPLFAWRRLVLRAFGAKLGRRAVIHPTVRIWAPWNLKMGDHSTLGPHVRCYAVDQIELGDHAVVSQFSHLCAASHDYTRPNLPLTTSPIRIGSGAWVAADAFVAPGVIIGAGAVVGARSVVTKNVAPWTVVAGHPARYLRDREVVTGETDDPTTSSATGSAATPADASDGRGRDKTWPDRKSVV